MFYLDGNWVDICSLAIAVLYAVVKSYRRQPCKPVSKATGVDLANGASLFPLLLLGVSVMSSKLLEELLKANKLILSVAGLCALLALLEDDF